MNKKHAVYIKKDTPWWNTVELNFLELCQENAEKTPHLMLFTLCIEKSEWFQEMTIISPQSCCGAAAMVNIISY